MSRRSVFVAARTLLFAALLCAPIGSGAQSDSSQTAEQQVKAAYLYRFAGYVQWPATAFASADSPITFAVVGDEPLAEALAQAVAGRTLNDRRVAVRRLKAGEPLAGIQVLFVGRAESARLSQLAQSARTRSILTVTESEGALAQGSVINFLIAERHVRFEISLDAAEKSGLRLSSRLLAVAQQVVPGVQ